MRSIIIGTAGHVDHGKTRLIGRLTGVNTDRLKEEQQRGISIELGFAELDLGDIQAGVVDVPGHERFVRTMVAGAGGVDMALLVVAADEGVMPQTREHVEVLQLLGVDRAVVALTKTDMVDAELAELAAEEVAEYLSETSLAEAPIVPVSSETGEGLPELRAEILKAAATLPERGSRGPFRLPIDRSFTLAGMGTIVTGTSWSGSVRVGDQLELLPQRRKVRVRSLQVHDKSVETAHAGQRTALALHGVKHDELHRGEVLVSEGRFQISRMVSLRVEVLPASPWTLRQRMRMRFHFGTQETLGRLILLDHDSLEPGQTGLAQARLEESTVCAPGDRIILRFYSPMRTVAGAEVLEAAAPKRRHGRSEDLEAVRLKEKGDPAEILAGEILETGLAGLEEKQAELLQEKYPGESPLPALLETGMLLRLGKRLFHRDAVDELAADIENHACGFQAKRPLAWGPNREGLRSALAPKIPQASFQKLLEHLHEGGRLRLRSERVRVGDAEPVPEGAAADWVARAEADWATGGLKPPAYAHLAELGVPEALVPDLASYLVDQGVLVRVQAEFLVHRNAVAALREGLRELFAAKDVIAVSDVGQRFDISRKFSVPLLEYCDKQSWTIRREAERSRGENL